MGHKCLVHCTSGGKTVPFLVGGETTDAKCGVSGLASPKEETKFETL